MKIYRIIGNEGRIGSGRDASLIAFLESLDEKQRYSALVHLSVLWAQSHDKTMGRDQE